MKKTYLQPITETLIWHAEDIMIPVVEVVSGKEVGGPENPGTQTNQAPMRVF